MSDDYEFTYVSTEEAVATFEASVPIFEGVLAEVRALSKKKPEATMSASKVKIVNRVLADLLTILKDEPAGKYLEPLSDDSLPQMSDAVLTMVQFEAALDAFKSRYHRHVEHAGGYRWITKELIAEWDKGEEGGDDDEDDEDDEIADSDGDDEGEDNDEEEDENISR